MALKAPKDTPLLYDSEHGLGWLDPFDCQVYFGMDMGDMDEKIAGLPGPGGQIANR